MNSILVRVGIIGVILLGAWILRPFITGDASSLAVGDCFDPPTAVGETVEDVQHHPCTDSHGAEVVYVGKYEGGTSTYPTDDEFFAYISSACTPAFNTYTGLDFQTDTTYDMSAFTPTAEGWGKGDRKIICYAVRLDEGKMNASIKKAS